MSRAGWNPATCIGESTSELELVGRQWRGRNRWAVCDEDIQLMREGRKCISCLELFVHPDGTSRAWPEQCPVCGYPVRAEQARSFAKEYEGKVRLGPATSDADEVERLTERTERRIWTPGGSVSVPRELG